MAGRDTELDEDEIDRQAFANLPDHVPRSAPPRWIGTLLAVVVLGALGFVGYKFALGYTVGGSDKASPNLAQIEEKLARMQKRLEQLEKRRAATIAEPPTTPKAGVTNQKPALSQSPPRPVFRISGASGQSSPAPAPDPGSNARVGLQQGLGSLRNDVAANRETLEATTDRLTDVVGEVNSQSKEIRQNREALNQLLARSERNLLRFELHRGRTRQPVGPVSLVLRSTDDRRQRYTVRVFVDDKWVEIKDRALYEAVKFYVSGMNIPLELIATQIHKEDMSGYLALPKEKPAR